MTYTELVRVADERRKEFDQKTASVRSVEDLEELRIRFLSRKGEVALLFGQIVSLTSDEKRDAGKILNELRTHIQTAFDNVKSNLENAAGQRRSLDLTLPGRMTQPGSLHPLTKTLREILTIFTRMGFYVAEGPEIEDDEHNFGSLNFAPDHPARDMQDTFFIDSNILLRTHTSPVQIRVMESQKPPVRVVIPGRVYRNEAVNARSYCLFHQVEGLAVDTHITFAELKGTLTAFAQQLFGSSLKSRFRASFFPFTEPSAEMDVTCFLCGGKGCRMCKQTGWLEILGCGMVDPNVFHSVHIDPERFSGYAFGMGIERIAILQYGIEDIRMFYENDIRFLTQF